MCSDGKLEKFEKKFKSALAKCKNGMYIRKSSVILDLNAKLNDDELIKKTSKKFEKQLDKSLNQCYIKQPTIAHE